MKPKLGKNSHGTKYLRDFLLANAAISEAFNLEGSKPPSPVTIQETEAPKGRALGEDLQAEESGGDSSGLNR